MRHGRDPYEIKCFASVTPILGRTVEEAQEKYNKAWEAASWQGGLAAVSGYSGIDFSTYDLDQPFDLDSAKGTPAIQGFMRSVRTLHGDRTWTPRELGKAFAFGGFGVKPTGTPEMVADIMEEWFHGADIDGFNLSCKSPS